MVKRQRDAAFNDGPRQQQLLPLSDNEEDDQIEWNDDPNEVSALPDSAESYLRSVRFVLPDQYCMLTIFHCIESKRNCVQMLCVRLI